MFDFFNRRIPKDIMKQAKETYVASPTPEVNPPMDKCIFTVGITPSGQTALKIELAGLLTTLTMNNAVVRQLIRLLEATLPEDDNNVNDEE